MSYTLKKNTDRSEIELTITVPPDEYQKELKKAAERISHRTAIKGFRKGNVPYDIIRRESGDMAILQEALQSIVQSSFLLAVQKENLETVGMPQITMEKIAPGNDVVYKATVAQIPAITLSDISSISITKKKKDATDADVDETIKALRGMQAAEVKKDGPAEGTDVVVVDMALSRDNVPVEGGDTKDYRVYLSESHYIPGFNKELVGLKKNDQKTFTLPFPDTHYQPHLAGKTVDISVTVKDVFERTLPELTDDFAKRLGQDTLSMLRDRIKKNMEEEAVRKAEEHYEIELLDALIASATFQQIPEVIINAEREKMFFELKRDLERHGVSIDQYLSDIKKTEEQIFDDFK
ncbi:MAG: trigger factor, partial [Patescibacteria group bacterium]